MPKGTRPKKNGGPEKRRREGVRAASSAVIAGVRGWIVTPSGPPRKEE